MATNVDLNASGHLFQQTESGSIDYKISVRALVSRAGLPAYTRVGSVITANANGALAAQDGVTLVAGERVLIADDNVAHADHGPYDLTSVGSAGTPFVFTRASDADASAEVTAGLLVHVAEGTSHLDSGWLLVTDDPITLNTTALNFRKGYQMGQVMTLNTAQTVSGDKTYTGALVLPQGAAPAQTAEGSIVWDTDDDVLTVGTGAGRKTMADLDSTQTLTNKTLTAPVIASRTSGAAGQTSTANVADGGSAVAHSFDNTTALTTTAKLASFKNAGVEKAAIEQGGAIIAPSIGTATTTQHALPTGTGALVSTDATQTLTGKTLTDPTINAGGGTLVLPAANAPSQTAEGSIVWDDDSDLLTVGTGAGRKTMVDTDSTQTLSGKTLTNPTINAGSGTIVLPASAAPAQTAEGSVVWDSDDDLLTVGDGAGRKVMVDTSSAQTLAGPKTLTNPVINAGSGTIVLPASAAPAQTAEGSVVWDSDDDLLTVGDGTGRKTMVDTSSAQTLAGPKTLTNPVVNAGSGTIVLPQSTTPSQTAEGSIVWDSDSDLLTVGDGTGRKTMVDTDSTQTLSGKTIASPTISGAPQITGSATASPDNTVDWGGAAFQFANVYATTTNGALKLLGSSPAAAADAVGLGVTDINGAGTAAEVATFEGGGVEQRRVMSTSGTVKRMTWAESVADDGTISLPTPTNVGKVMVHSYDEDLNVLVKPDLALVKAQSTTNTDILDTDNRLCVFNDSGTLKVKNRLGGARFLVIEYRIA